MAAPRAFVALVIVACCALDIVAQSQPKLVWSQDKERLFLRFQVKAAEDVKVTATRSTLSFSALGGIVRADGNGRDLVAYEMVLDLREDVHADSMTYEAKPKETTVVLTKEYPHFFDRLVVDEKMFERGVLKKDLTVYSDQKKRKKRSDDDDDDDDNGEASTHEDQEEDPKLWKNVIELTDGNFGETLQSTDLVAVLVTLPWCHICVDDKDEFARAALELSKPKTSKILSKLSVKLGRVDARNERLLRRHFNATCDSGDYTCVMHLYKRGEGNVTVSPIPIKAEEIISKLEYFGKPVYTTLPSASSVAAYSKKHRPLAVVGLFNSDKGIEHNVFTQLAMSNRVSDDREQLPENQRMHFAAVTTHNGANSVRLYRKRTAEAASETEFDGSWTVDALQRWALTHRSATLGEYDAHEKDLCEESGRAVALLFLPPYPEHEYENEPTKMKPSKAMVRAKKALKAAGAALRSEMCMFFLDDNNADYMLAEDHGVHLEPERTAAFFRVERLSANITDVSAMGQRRKRRYKPTFDGAEKVTEAELRQFLQQAIAGTAPAAYKNAFPSDNWFDQRGRLHKVNRDGLDSSLHNLEHDVVLLLHWSIDDAGLAEPLEGEAANVVIFKKQLRILASMFHLANEETIRFIRMDTTRNEPPHELDFAEDTQFHVIFFKRGSSVADGIIMDIESLIQPTRQAWDLMVGKPLLDFVLKHSSTDYTADTLDAISSRQGDAAAAVAEEGLEPDEIATEEDEGLYEDPSDKHHDNDADGKKWQLNPDTGKWKKVDTGKEDKPAVPFTDGPATMGEGGGGGEGEWKVTSVEEVPDGEEPAAGEAAEHDEL